MRQAVTMFAAGLLLRLAYWLLSAQPDAPATADYAGDAAYWQQIAAGQAGLEAVLPFRPPAMSWLAQACWDGSGAALLPRLLLALMGAAIGPGLYLATRASLGGTTAQIAGWICALSHGLIVLGGGVHSEIPYLLLVTLTLADFERLRTQRSLAAAARWSLLHAGATLFRADHLLHWSLCMLWLMAKKQQARARDLGLAGLVFALALLPWQVHANRAVDDFNAGRLGRPAPDLPLPGFLPWDADAMAAVRAMPAFAQAPSAAFVNDSVRARGRDRVTRQDLDILVEAYGCTPEPLHKGLVAIYGPLNFFLANAAEGDGGFTRAPLDRRPAFAGGMHLYPTGIERVLPKELELGYPPHLQAMNHGYREGLRWLFAHPGDAAQRLVAKLMQAWRGATTGLGLCNLPLGRSATRAPVDLAVAGGPLAGLWRWSLLALLAYGAWTGRRDPWLAPFAIWGLASAAVCATFFGYARLGALCIPAAAALWSAALTAAPPIRRVFATTRPRMLIAMAIALLLLDLAAAALWRAPTVRLSDGQHGPAQIEYGRPQ